jgi:colanic acid biosynthesis glycosyl transferase WcaI
MALHLTFFNRCYWPDSEATGQLLTELAEFLAPRHSVRVVVGQPNFAESNADFVTLGTQSRNGVEINRLQHSQIPKDKKFGRIRNLVSFTLAVRKWLRTSRSANSSTPLHPNNRPIWICETDPFLLPLVVGPAARRRGARVIYYLQDIYPDVAVALGVTKNSIPIRTLRQQLKKQYNSADHIIVLDDDMKSRLANWSVDEHRMSVIPNWMDCSTVRPIKEKNPLRDQWGLHGKFVLMHSGNMGMTQNLHVLVDAMKRTDTPHQCQLLLVGNGAKRAELERQAAGARNVLFQDYQPREKLAESLSVADLHVVSMDAAITGCLAPSKLYGILASASPVLAIVPKDNSVWKLVTENRLGWCVDPGNTQGIIDAVNDAISLDHAQMSEMGLRGRYLAETLFDKTVCCQAFETLLGSISETV